METSKASLSLSSFFLLNMPLVGIMEASAQLIQQFGSNSGQWEGAQWLGQEGEFSCNVQDVARYSVPESTDEKTSSLCV